jgi:hypothetical protein
LKKLFAALDFIQLFIFSFGQCQFSAEIPTWKFNAIFILKYNIRLFSKKEQILSTIRVVLLLLSLFVFVIVKLV